ncbi:MULTISPECIES: GbsR/MarR family transcriptional regulator [Mesoflavibacter]|uniref:Transcriptional regulator n=1 Tax=Mesoflavibacter profundi TaxID=2708110 RepID=A0ABT4S1Y5_9FLAO|nr:MULTISPECIES: transcriptional regulator [Mesoflavibacter]MDA0178069.1 transcriptional regulator [Mesoflavibacter profundi]QIJ89030.1 hypothetical protein C7H62_1221 [Mesoflavibacter sp. HG96]QIJ91758.1 hypothetical protein C7H56_1221 [Mesoflavibacter sp. HG37]
MTLDLLKQKHDLVERLGIVFEQTDQLAPVAARILSYIILTGDSGTTFEELVDKLCASKSTISTHLNHLSDLKKIKYFTKTGDRKKYFIKNPDTIFQRIDRMVEDWKIQIELHKEIKQYKEKMNELVVTNQEEKFKLDFHDSYLIYLNEAINSLEKLRIKILEIEKK